MPDPSPLREAAARARVATACLAVGSGIDIASLALTVVAIVALLWLGPALPLRLALWCATTAGLAEKVFALRVGFDRSIFQDWAIRWGSSGSASPSADMAAFDAALAATGLRRQGKTTGRGLDERIRGAMKLLTYQLCLFIIQVLAIVTAVVYRHGF